MKALIKILRKLFTPTLHPHKHFNGSYVRTYYVDSNDIETCCIDHTGDDLKKITSVSVTRVDTDLSPMKIDKYMVMISYDIYKIIWK